MKPLIRHLFLALLAWLFISTASAYYDPRLGRWLSRDPIGEEGGINLYAYCDNDPVNRHDPTGLSPGGYQGRAFIRAHVKDPRRRDAMLSEFNALWNDNQKYGYLGPAALMMPLAVAALPEVTPAAYASADWLFAGGGMQTVSMWGARTALVAGVGTVAYDAAQGASPLDSLQHGAGIGFNLWSATGFGMPNLRMPNFLARQLTVEDFRSQAEARINAVKSTYGDVEAYNHLSKGKIDYGALDALGRPTGVRVTLTPDMIKTGTPAASWINPPGFLGGSLNQARGHLLGAQLGGSGAERRNLVTIQHIPTNMPVMRGVETQIRSIVESGQTFEGSFIPVYMGNNLIPRAITLQGTGSNGSIISISILNPLGL